MSEYVLPPGQDEDEIGELAEMISENLDEGVDPGQIIGQLVDSGWEEGDAVAFVTSIGMKTENSVEMVAHSGEKNGYGWLIWIGFLLFSLLRYFFEK
ncbi:MAG: hypothetical protein ACPIA2_06035 [Mariniblastus sp.]